jgi:hypothetical protein
MPVRVGVSDEIAGVDLSEHGEAAYHGGEVGTLAGWRPALGDSVLIPAAEVARTAPAVARAPGG